MKSPVFDVISALLSGAREGFNSSLTNPDWPWEECIKIASIEYVLPTLCRRLRDPEVAPFVPGVIREFALSVEALSLERNREFLNETADLAGLLNRAGIQPVLLKGMAYLTRGVYPHVSERFVGDIDLLVPGPALGMAVQILEKQGYFPAQPTSLLVGHHYPRLLGARKIGIELHHSLGIGICNSILPADDVLRNAVPFRLGSTDVLIPSAAHLVTHQIMHSQLHDKYSERIWPSLRAMYDLMALRRCFGSTLDWQEVRERFRRNRRFGVLAAHLLLVKSLLGGEEPFPITEGGLLRLRRFHRMLLRKSPGLRRVDPIYWFESAIVPRTRLVGEIIKIPSGWKYLLRTPARIGFYKNLISNVEDRRQ